MKYYLFGAGNNGRMYAENNATLPIAGFIDNDDSKNGVMLSGIPVMSYTEFRGKCIPTEDDKIIITSMSFRSIYGQLDADGFGKKVAGFSLYGGGGNIFRNFFFVCKIF